MNLYFKPYTCCRWAHPPIRASLALKEKHSIDTNRIKEVNVYTFKLATMLSKMKPKLTDEAQYNISYPIAAAIVDGDLGFEQVIESKLDRKEVTDLMDRINYVIDDELEARFPAERLCRVEFVLDDGTSYTSEVIGAEGEAKDNVDLNWIIKKFRRRTRSIIKDSSQDKLLEILTDINNNSVRQIVDYINNNC